MIHYTVEEIMSMPGYCRDKYEKEIAKLELKLKNLEQLFELAKNQCLVTEHKSPETLAPKSKRADVSVVSETNPEGTLSGLERVNSCVEKEKGEQK